MAVRVNVSEGTVYGEIDLKQAPSHMNFARLFLDKILQYGDKIALINGETDEQISFLEMAQKIVNVAYSLVQLGVKEGETVAICSENRIEFVITAIAVLYSGAVATFFNCAYNHDEIVHTAKISKPKYMFLSTDAYNIHYNTLKELNTIKRFFIFGGKDKGRTDVIHFEELAEKSIEMANYEGANFYGRAHTALILYSSGTTGLPKGVKLTHLNYITTIYQVPVTIRPITMLSVAPFTHTMGFQNLTISLIFGKTVVFLNKFTEASYFRAIEKYKVPPSELEAILLKHPKVLDAAVLGKPDKLAGELPTAFIVKKPGSNVTEREVIEFLDSKVSPWKRLRGGVQFVEEIPKNPSGKILRRLLRETLIKPASKL